MDHLKMHSQNKIDANISKIANLFPNCVTEAKDDNGEIIHKIDFDMLKQELSSTLVEGREERYQFTWPDKKQAILTANAPINKTLRPCREESVNFDSTENLYIEGDNLEVLKLLQETYLGKIKMIYIDPPYNTGNDFVYEDDFAQDATDYIANSGQTDEEGNRLVANTESNGRFHTDWLNMMYPRLKLARDLLSDDGVIFISIDDNEVENLKKICNEVFGEGNFIAQFPWRKRTAKSDVPFGVSQDYEWIICCAKSEIFKASIEGGERKYYETPDFPGRPWRVHDLTKQTTASERPNSFFTMVNPKTREEYPANPNRTWAITQETFEQYMKEDKIVFPGDYDFLKITKPAFRYWKEDDIKKAGDNFGKIAVSTKLPDNIGMSQDGTKEITELMGTKAFPFPKSVDLIKHLVKISTNNYSLSSDNYPLILDFFSGSATTAHAVMQLNAEDGGKRKFIMVQLPEVTDEKSEAYKAGYKNICEIGKERIRRAGRKILETTIQTGGGTKDSAPSLDIGFRVLKCDTSNMEDVYYTPDHFDTNDLFKNNIKSDRTGEDLLFQTMLDLGIMLSSKIETKEINSKEVFCVEGNYLMACFDDSVDEKTITEIAKEKPYYFVMRDPANSKDGDSLITNFEQIFTTYSPDTVRKIL
ncbi:MAG: site-specific DNA-methyltransferase [Treponema sp.]|nr:site-specific DNA-methyltransferase [Treponema sp.]MBO6219683.1 site-specific DNA-methyltransferase [Treponema sp.]